jgi:hypothetical protein
MNYELRTAYNRQLETVSPRIEDVRILTYEIINLFLQNEPKFRKSQVNVNSLLTEDYDKMDTWSNGKNEPKTNPNEPKFKMGKINITIYITKEYDDTGNLGPKKRTQNKPNLSRRSLWQSRNKTQIQGRKMLLRLTIKGRRALFGCSAEQIEAPSDYDRPNYGNRRKSRNCFGKVDLIRIISAGRNLNCDKCRAVRAAIVGIQKHEGFGSDKNNNKRIEYRYVMFN